MPAISVIMPVYNRVETAPRAVASVLAQEFCDFELIVVDDASDDGAPALIAGYDDPRIRVLRQPSNLGSNAARNRGILAARSPIISFIDSDDEFLPGKLGTVAAYFAAHPEIDVLIDSFEIVYPSSRRRSVAPRINFATQDSSRVREAIFARTLYKATPALSARRQALFDVGLFDETLKRRQDMDLVLRLTQKARCATTDEILWTKHWSRQSISAKRGTFAQAMIDICERHPEYLTQPSFRVGLARDLAREVLRCLRRGSLAGASSVLSRFREHVGTRMTLRLLVEGVGEMIRRARRGASRPKAPEASGRS